MSYVEMRSVNPQACFVSKTIEVIRSGRVIALPTDSGYAIAYALGNKAGMDPIRRVRRLNEKHDFSLLCHSFAQPGELVLADSLQFRTIKTLTLGIYIFVLPETKEVPRITLNKKKHTVGVRIPDHVITQTIVEALGEPLSCPTLILPGEKLLLINSYEVDEAIRELVDLMIVGPIGRDEVMTVIDFTEGSGMIARRGAGDTSLSE